MTVAFGKLERGFSYTLLNSSLIIIIAMQEQMQDLKKKKKKKIARFFRRMMIINIESIFVSYSCSYSYVRLQISITLYLIAGFCIGT